MLTQDELEKEREAGRQWVAMCERQHGTRQAIFYSLAIIALTALCIAAAVASI